MRRKTVRKILCSVFSIVLVVALCACCLQPLRVSAEEQTVNISLHKGNPEENLPLEMTNMVPGDGNTQMYRVSVSYKDTITVGFRILPKSGDEALGEALVVEVRLTDTDKVLYNGTLKDMPELKHVLTTGSDAKTEEICYEITVSMSKSAGNEYQNKSLAADFVWWAEENGGSLVTPPATGDGNRIVLILAMLAIAAIAMVLLAQNRKRLRFATEDAGSIDGVCALNKKNRRWNRVWKRMFFAVLLVIGLSVTTLALAWNEVVVENNLFQTGTVKVDLNGGEPVFAEDILFEPGMVVQKSFTITNEGSTDVFYRLWFSEIEGGLAKKLTVKVTDGDQTIFSGTLMDMMGQKSEGANGTLEEGQEKEITIEFALPAETGDDMQGTSASFDLNLDAVQKAHNSGEEFQ